MLEHVIVSENFTSIVVGGDFNVDVCREALHTRLLLDFLSSHELVCCTILDGSKVDYTYNFDDRRFSTIDHFMVNKELVAIQDVSVSVEHSVDNLSDHDPITVMLNLEVDRMLATPVFRGS
jgi:endonuclease/exonuclease/phosphatase family metal-dependent hydrolase